jgi:hypothetical protein
VHKGLETIRNNDGDLDFEMKHNLKTEDSDEETLVRNES